MKRTILAAAMLLLAAPVMAQTAAVGGVLFLQSDLTKDGSFDISRGYVNIGAAREAVSVRFTTDINRVGGIVTTKVKYAYAQYDLNPTSSVRFGASQTPWIDFEEHINRYRVQGTLTAERTGILPSSSDFGVSYATSTKIGKRGIDVQGGIFNGEGVYGGDPNTRKSLQGRLTADVGFQGVKVSGFATSDEVYIASAHRATTHTVVLVEHLKKDTLIIDSIFGEVRQGARGFAGFARADLGDTDRYILGGAYWFNPVFGVVVSNDRTEASGNRALAQVQAGF